MKTRLKTKFKRCGEGMGDTSRIWDSSHAVERPRIRKKNE